jgi:hypothetical protein
MTISPQKLSQNLTENHEHRRTLDTNMKNTQATY